MAAPVVVELPAWSVRVIAELEAADRRLRDIAGGLRAEQLNWNPRPGSWSIGQCVQHLLLTNQVYLPPMADALGGRRRARVEEIRVGWFGRWFMRNYIEASAKGKRVAAPEKIVPPERVEVGVVEAFVRSNEGARELVRRASEYDVNRIRFRNPFIPALRFTVGTGLEIVWKHQVRHLGQMERVRGAEGFPAK